MSKVKFEKYILKNLKNIESICCRVWNGQGETLDNACWLDVYIDGVEFETIFCSDCFEENSKEVFKLQKQWADKLKKWINPNWNINLIIDEQCV